MSRKVHRNAVFVLLFLLSSCTARTDTPQLDDAVSTPPQPETGLAAVSSIEILSVSGAPEQIHILVQGSLQDACAALDEPAVDRQDFQIRIALSYTRRPGESCAQQPQDFEKTIPYDLSGLPHGEYILSVNGKSAAYTFMGEVDQAQVSANPTASPQDENQPEPEDPPVPEPTSSSPQPVDSTPRGCTDVAAFFGDVTIPDNTPFEQNSPFYKTWAIRNEGTCTWDGNYSLTFAGGDPMSGPLNSPLPETKPGETMNVSIDLVSPAQGGQYTGYYEFTNAEGKRFGVNSGGIDKIWVTISVSWYKPGESEPSAGIPVTAQNSSCGYSENQGYVNQLFELINRARADQGLAALELDSRLSSAALKHSIDMGCQGFLDHTGSDGSKFGQRVKAEGYSYSYVSENIYAGSPDFGGNAQGAFDWWMNSTVHRNNILSTKVTQIGIGFALVAGSPYGGYYTLNFARP